MSNRRTSLPWQLKVLWVAHQLIFMSISSQAFVPKLSSSARISSLRRSMEPDARQMLDSLKKEAREEEIRDKLEKIRQLKKQGLNYKGEVLSEESTSKIDTMANALLENKIDEAERFFQDADQSTIGNEGIGQTETSNNGEIIVPKGGQLDAGLQATIDAAAQRALGTELPAVESSEESGEKDETAPKLATSGIGGNWKSPDNEVVVHKPSTSGSWGVFERPADISKAYGGGKRIGVGGVPTDPELVAKKQSETAAALARFRQKSGGADPLVEKQNAPAIAAALSSARASMAKGRSADAVSALVAVKPFLSFGTLTGGECYLELGMALEAAGQANDALSIYKKVAAETGDDAIAKQAKQLMFGFEAMDFFRVDTSELEASKLTDKLYKGSLAEPVIAREAWSGEFYEKSYDATFMYLSKEKRRALKLDEKYKCKDFGEAREIILRAATFKGRSREIAFGSGKIMGALSKLSEARGGAESKDDPLQLSGRWRLAIATKPSPTGATGNDISFLIKPQVTTLRKPPPLQRDDQRLSRISIRDKRNNSTSSSSSTSAAMTPNRNGTASTTASASTTAPASASSDAWTMRLQRVLVEAPPSSASSLSPLPPTPTYRWEVPQMHVALPFLGAKADCSGSVVVAGNSEGEEAWPNPHWGLHIELTKGRLAAAFGLPLPAVPQPPPSTVLTVDNELLVTMATSPGETRPSFDVWIREGKA